MTVLQSLAQELLHILPDVDIYPNSYTEEEVQTVLDNVYNATKVFVMEKTRKDNLQSFIDMIDNYNVALSFDEANVMIEMSEIVKRIRCQLKGE